MLHLFLFFLSLHSDSWVGGSLLGGRGSPEIPSVKCAVVGFGKSSSHTLLLNSVHRTWNGRILARMLNDNANGAQKLLKRERDERTGEFLQAMLNNNLGEASEGLK